MVRSLSVLACFIASAAAFGDDAKREIVSHPTGGNPYSIVAPQDATKDQPAGVYVREPQGGWSLLIRGAVSSPPATGGFSHYLKSNQFLRRYESAAIIDDKLTFFSLKTNAKKTGTSLVLGAKEAAVKNPVDQRIVPFPALKMGEHSIWSTTYTIDRRVADVVLVSVKGANPFGSGMTVGFGIYFDAKDHKPTLESGPWLLDWEYYSETELAQFFFAEDGDLDKPGLGFRCPLWEGMLARERAGDPPLVKLWREELRGVMAKSKKKHVLLDESYPFLRLDNGAFEINGLISREVPNHELVAIFDPVHGRHGVYSLKSLHNDFTLALSELDDYPPLIPGAAEMKNGADVVSSSQASDDWLENVVFIRMVGNQFRVLARVGSKYHSVKLAPPGGEAATDANFLIVREGNDEDRTYVVVSWKLGATDKKGVTVAYEFEHLNEAVVVTRAITLNKEYLAGAQLNARLRLEKIDDPDEDGAQKEQVVFGTSHVKISKSAKTPPKPDTAPPIALGNSLDEQTLWHVFLNPTAQYQMTKNIEYRVFPKIRGVESSTGFYRKSGNGFRLMVRGEAVTTKKDLAASLPLDTKTLTIPQGLNSDRNFTVAAALVDTEGSKGKQTRLAFSIEDLETGDVSMEVVNSPKFDVSSLENFLFLEPRKVWAYERLSEFAFYGIAIFKKKTLIVPIPMKDLDAKEKFKFPPINAWVLENRKVPADELARRLRFIDGMPYIVVTPDLAQDDWNYAIKNCLDGSPLYINRDLSKKIQFDAEGSASLPSSWGRINTWALTLGSRREDRFRKIFSRVRGAVEFRRDVFSEYRELLDGLATPGTPPRHIVYLVPAELKSYLSDYPLALYMRRTVDEIKWNDRNHELLLSIPDPESENQNEVLTNLASMREMAADRTRLPVLFGTLSDLIALGAPETDSGSEAFRLQDVSFGSSAPIPLEDEIDLASPAVTAARDDAGGDDGSDDDATEEDGDGKPTKKSDRKRSPNTKMHFPHILYLLANEGQRTSLAKFSKKVKPTYSMLLVGTEEEWQRMQADAALEGRSGLFEHFEVRSLSNSPKVMRRQMIAEVLGAPELKAMGYELDIAGIIRNTGSYDPEMVNQEEFRRRKFAEYVDQRVEALARQYRVHSFVALMRFLNTFSDDVSNDPNLRRAKRIDRAAIERTMVKIFPVPLSLLWLPENDPMKTLMRPDFLLLWEQKSHKGYPEVKRKILDVLKTQLDVTSVKNVPASFLIYGDTGTGKTSLLRSLFSTLDLKMYDLKAPNADLNKDAHVFFLDMGAFGKDGDSHSEAENPGGGDSLDLDDAIRQFHQFLLSPNGAQGFVVLDDFHKASDKARTAWLKILRYCFNNPYYTVGGKQIPTRNLRFFVTLNPTDVKSRIKEYTSNLKKGPTDEEVILATLNVEGQAVFDRSEIARFGALVKMGTFSAKAKGPALLEHVRNEQKNQFNTDGNLIVVTEEAADSLAREFKPADARTFLSSAAKAMTDRGNSGTAPAVDSLHILVPRPEFEVFDEYLPSIEYEANGGSEDGKIRRYVEQHFHRLSINDSAEGKIQFLLFMVNNFRRMMLELFFQSISASRRTLLSVDYDNLILSPIARGLNDHMLTQKEFPIDLLQLQYNHLTSGAAEQRELRDTVRRIRVWQYSRQRSLPLVGILPPSSEGEGIFDSSLSNEKTRQHVLRRLVDGFGDLGQDVLRSWFSDDASGNVSIKDWLSAIPEDAVSLRDQFSEKIVDTYYQYLFEIYDREVSATATQRRELSHYEAARLFAMAVDRAIGQLPWSKLTSRMIEALALMTGDLTLGGERSIQRFLFDAKSSPLVPRHRSFLLQRFQSTPEFGNVTGLRDNPAHRDFIRSCQDILRASAHVAGGEG